MSMKFVGIKVPIETYEQLKARSEITGGSISEIIRRWIDEGLNADKTAGENGKIDDKTGINTGFTSVLRMAEQLEDQLHEKDRQLEEKDKQISELHQLLAMQSKTSAQLTEQLDAMKQLEDMRQRPSWWGRLLGKA